MQSLKQSLIVLVMLILSACSSLPSTLPMVKVQTPTACLTPCHPLPQLVNGSDLEIRRWEYLAIEAFGACRRLHQDCVESVR